MLIIIIHIVSKCVSLKSYFLFFFINLRLNADNQVLKHFHSVRFSLSLKWSQFKKRRAKNIQEIIENVLKHLLLFIAFLPPQISSLSLLVLNPKEKVRYRDKHNHKFHSFFLLFKIWYRHVADKEKVKLPKCKRYLETFH